MHESYHRHAALVTIPVLLKATFTASIQLSLGLLCNHLASTFAINILLAILCSSILSMYSNQFPLVYCTITDQLYSCTSMHLFIPNSINLYHCYQTSLISFNLKHIHFFSLASSLPSYNTVVTISS